MSYLFYDITCQSLLLANFEGTKLTENLLPTENVSICSLMGKPLVNQLMNDQLMMTSIYWSRLLDCYKKASKSHDGQKTLRSVKLRAL